MGRMNSPIYDVVRDVVPIRAVPVEHTKESELRSALQREEVVLIRRLRLQALLATVPHVVNFLLTNLLLFLVIESAHHGEVVQAREGVPGDL